MKMAFIDTLQKYHVIKKWLGNLALFLIFLLRSSLAVNKTCPKSDAKKNI